MGRAPCCEKMGLKKGPWSHDEDQVLTSYIQQHGHPNWRALPKHAGLLRCGKSCRLRWTNYLRPDIKRGNFSREEEDTIIHLHEMLGNRWSVIATNLPGRTDNEIKNVWHTYLKKRLGSQETTNDAPKKHKTKSKRDSNNSYLEVSVVEKYHVQPQHNLHDGKQAVSIQPSCSESSSVTEATADDSLGTDKHEEIKHDTFLDYSFWSETLSVEVDDIVESTPTTNISSFGVSSSPLTLNENQDLKNSYIDCNIGNIDLWYDIFTRIEELPELPKF